jgi:hypothetical protein
MKKRVVKATPDISEYTEKEVVPMWTQKDMIRNRNTGKPYKVIHVYSSGLTLVIELQDKSEFIQPVGIPEREYYKYTLDSNEENTDPVNYEGTWYEHTIRM